MISLFFISHFFISMINTSTWIFYKPALPVVYFYYAFYVVFGLFIMFSVRIIYFRYSVIRSSNFPFCFADSFSWLTISLSDWFFFNTYLPWSLFFCDSLIHPGLCPHRRVFFFLLQCLGYLQFKTSFYALIYHLWLLNL